MSVYPGIVEGDLSIICHLLMPEVARTTRGIKAYALVTTYGYPSYLSNFVLGERPR